MNRHRTRIQRARLLAGACILASAPFFPVGVAEAARGSVSGVGGTAVGAAATTQAQSGTAAGAESFFVFLGQQHESGTYSTHGQLGSGHFAIDTTYNDSHCTKPGDTMPLTGTAYLIRFDGARLTGTVAGTEGCLFVTPQPVSLTLDLGSGTQDLVTAVLVLSGTRTFGAINPGGEADSSKLQLAGSASFTKPIGYWMVGAKGAVAGFGGLTALGNAPTTAVTHLEPTPDHRGYWVVDAAGHVFALGDAAWLGNAPGSSLAAGETVTNLSATPSGAGYWLFTTRGRALQFGDASFFGDMHAITLNGPVVGAIATPTGRGYYMVASDGGVFAFGDAIFRGSMGAVRLNRPVNGLVPTADNTGYWLVAADGGVFTFNAPFLGSMGNRPLNRPVVGMTRYSTGYLMVGSDGGVFKFSNSLFFGSLAGSPPASPIVSVSAVS